MTLGQQQRLRRDGRLGEPQQVDQQLGQVPGPVVPDVMDHRREGPQRRRGGLEHVRPAADVQGDAAVRHGLDAAPDGRVEVAHPQRPGPLRTGTAQLSRGAGHINPDRPATQVREQAARPQDELAQLRAPGQGRHDHIATRCDLGRVRGPATAGAQHGPAPLRAKIRGQHLVPRPAQPPDQGRSHPPGTHYPDSHIPILRTGRGHAAAGPAGSAESRTNPAGLQHRMNSVSQPETGSDQTCDRCGPAVRAAYCVRRHGQLYLCKHCANRLWPDLSRQGWNIWPVGEPCRAGGANK